MFSQSFKAGAALALLLANVQMAAAQVQAQDLARTATAQTQTASVKAASFLVAEGKQETMNDSQMSSLPDSGNLAMLVAGICMIGFAARRRPA
ncbi:hypothetical protein [Sandaracinobacteroides hominis]|uniref:hypothetical protein n=1 Tax=Sandaracinobacteroides hominis TaxID=2780086 RepID=UPI0018F4A5B3|nr:hypothetical protein [Sandaracinobacteroides hominis]